MTERKGNWFVFAYFRWSGKVGRLTFLGASLMLLVMEVACLLAVSWVAFSRVDSYYDYGRGLDSLVVGIIVIVLLLVVFEIMSMLLKAKRLRSFGAPPLIAPALLLIYILGIFLGRSGFIVGIIQLLAFLVLVLVPPKPDQLRTRTDVFD